MSAEWFFDAVPAKIKPLFSLLAVSRPHTNVTFHCACRCVVVMPSMLPLCLSSSGVVPAVQPRGRSIWMVSDTKQIFRPYFACTCSPPCSGPPVLLKDLQVIKNSGIPPLLPLGGYWMNGCGMPVPQWIALFSELVQCRSSRCNSEVSLQTGSWRVITVILPNANSEQYQSTKEKKTCATYPQLLF